MSGKNFQAMLADAKLPEKSVPICLRGDLVADFEEAERLLVEANKSRGDSLAGGEKLGELAERVEQLREQMRDHFYDFRLRALPKRQWRALVAEHQPRRVDGAEGPEVHEDDKYIGVNAETFFDAMIRACLVDPELDDQQWAHLLEVLSDKQYEALSSAAWGVNRSDVDVPFSHVASLISRRTGSE